jgi:hypothetical protein
MARSPKRTLSSRFPDENPPHIWPSYSRIGRTAIDFTTIEMWRIYLNENSLVAYPSGCVGLVELLLHKQIYRGQSERLQIWIQTNPGASDNFRQHSLWQVTFITCTVITGQHGERELHGCCSSVHHIFCRAATHIPFWVQRYLLKSIMMSEVSYALVEWVTVKFLGIKLSCTLGWPSTEATWLYCDYLIWRYIVLCFCFNLYRGCLICF